MSTINTTKAATKTKTNPIPPLPGLEGFPTKSVVIPTQPGTSNVLELGWNGRMYLLQRGRKIQLPLPLYHILEHAGLTGKGAGA